MKTRSTFDLLPSGGSSFNTISQRVFNPSEAKKATKVINSINNKK